MFISQTCYQHQTISIAFHWFLTVLYMAASPLLLFHNTFVVWDIISLGVFIMICFSYGNYFISIFKIFIMNSYFINLLIAFIIFNSMSSCVIFWCFLYFVLVWWIIILYLNWCLIIKPSLDKKETCLHAVCILFSPKYDTHKVRLVEGVVMVEGGRKGYKNHNIWCGHNQDT